MPNLSFKPRLTAFKPLHAQFHNLRACHRLVATHAAAERFTITTPLYYANAGALSSSTDTCCALAAGVGRDSIQPPYTCQR